MFYLRTSLIGKRNCAIPFSNFMAVFLITFFAVVVTTARRALAVALTLKLHLALVINMRIDTLISRAMMAIIIMLGRDYSHMFGWNDMNRFVVVFLAVFARFLTGHFVRISTFWSPINGLKG